MLILLGMTFLLLSSASAQEMTIPCDFPRITPSAAGDGTWVVCRKLWPAWFRDTNRATAATTPPPPSANSDPSELYWLSFASKNPQKIASGRGVIRVIPSPKGSKALVVMPNERGWGTVVLYDGPHRMKNLPIEAYSLVWSGDAERIHFRGGSTLNGDAWNILATYNLDSGKTRKTKLRYPTEIVGVCSATGSVFTVTPSDGGYTRSTVEYTPELKFVRKINKWGGADFSATCVYVSSPSSYHGPIPWSIYQIASGRKLFDFDAFDVGQDSVVPLGWNPIYDPLILRTFTDGKTRTERIEVFDVARGVVLETLPTADSATWDRDGEAVLIVRGTTLMRQAVRKSH